MGEDRQYMVLFITVLNKLVGTKDRQELVLIIGAAFKKL